MKSGNAVSTGPIVSVLQTGGTQSIEMYEQLFQNEKGFKFSHHGNFGQFTLVRTDNNFEYIVMRWNDNGHLIFGGTLQAHEFAVNGQASKSSSGAWLGNSDRRLKRNISTIEQKWALDQLLKMTQKSRECKNPL